jgi:hypothetical protein
LASCMRSCLQHQLPVVRWATWQLDMPAKLCTCLHQHSASKAAQGRRGQGQASDWALDRSHGRRRANCPPLRSDPHVCMHLSIHACSASVAS